MNDSSPAEKTGRKQGKDDLRGFVIIHCPCCNLYFVGNPRQDYSNFYFEAYYRGQGVYPHVDYLYELEHFDETICGNEWMGILDIILSIYPVSLSSVVRWLDDSCVNGGLVRYVRSSIARDITGCDKCWAVGKAVESGIPITGNKGSLNSATKFDIITPIDVLEHVEDPINALLEIRSLMKPGGLFFFMTRDSLPYRKDLLNLTYFRPDIHVSFYESKTVEIALKKAGFRYLLLERLSYNCLGG